MADFPNRSPYTPAAIVLMPAYELQVSNFNLYSGIDTPETAYTLAIAVGCQSINECQSISLLPDNRYS